MTNNYPAYKAPPVPKEFIRRRLHSLLGLWLVLFLIEHLLVNSQAALFIGDNGSGFVRAVNSIKSFPYLPVIEIFLIGVPFLFHGYWGILYLFNSELNSFPTNGTTPALPQYKRNQAFTWQRITSWILVFGVLAHTIHMRIANYPISVQRGIEHIYLVRLNHDPGLYTLSKRIGFDIYSPGQIRTIRQQMLAQLQSPPPQDESPQSLIRAQERREKQAWIKAFEWYPLQSNQVLASSQTFGTAELLLVRDSFKNPIIVFLYTVFVLAACFHAFNGLWTAMITWGITLTATSQWLMRRLSIGLMVLITFLGLAAIWGTYWLNLMN